MQMLLAYLFFAAQCTVTCQVELGPASSLDRCKVFVKHGNVKCLNAVDRIF